MDNSNFLSIVDIVGQYVQCTPEGERHYSARCPFCSSAENSLILSMDTQYWVCLSCGADGDRYDFVAKSENISKAEAILMVGHHSVSGEPFPHARFGPGRPSAKVAEAAVPKQATATAPAPAATVPPEPPRAKPAASPAVATPGSAGKIQSVPFLEFRNIIPSYQGAAILDNESRMTHGDSEYPSSAELAGIGEILAPILAHAGTAFAQWGIDAGLPAVLTVASDNLAFLVHKFGPADNFRLLVVRLANPADVPVARRLVASVATRIA